jgi:two-component system chemotaxis response regulator CheB
MPARKLTPLRVAIADGSSFMRRLLAESLLVRGFEVAGLADSTDSAVDLCQRARPDALTFDLVSPQMDGVVLLRSLRDAGLPVPVILLGGQFRADAYRMVDALIEGGLDFLERPMACDTVQVFLSELADRIRLSAHLHERRRRAVELVSERRVHALPQRAEVPRPEVSRDGVQRAVVMVGSTGGVHSLSQLVPALPPGLGIGTVVVQRLPDGFTSALADRLNRLSALEVREARGGEKLERSSLYLAPGGSHLRLAGEGKLLVSTEAPVAGLRPRADLTIMDAASIFGERLLLVVLSGTGKDGVDGAREVKRGGGRVLVEAESTAIASATPRAVIEANLADEVVELEELAAAIVANAGRWGSGEAREELGARRSYDRSA